MKEATSGLSGSSLPADPPLLAELAMSWGWIGMWSPASRLARITLKDLGAQARLARNSGRYQSHFRSLARDLRRRLWCWRATRFGGTVLLQLTFGLSGFTMFAWTFGQVVKPSPQTSFAKAMLTCGLLLGTTDYFRKYVERGRSGGPPGGWPALARERSASLLPFASIASALCGAYVGATHNPSDGVATGCFLGLGLGIAVSITTAGYRLTNPIRTLAPSAVGAMAAILGSAVTPWLSWLPSPRWWATCSVAIFTAPLAYGNPSCGCLAGVLVLTCAIMMIGSTVVGAWAEASLSLLLLFVTYQTSREMAFLKSRLDRGDAPLLADDRCRF